MSIAVSPKLTINIQGDDISTVSKINTWTLGEKIELIKTFKNTDGDITIDLTPIQDMELIEFYSASAFNIKLTIGTNVIELAVANGFFILNTVQAFIDSLDSLEINTDSTTDISVQIGIYGNEVTA